MDLEGLIDLTPIRPPRQRTEDREDTPHGDERPPPAGNHELPNLASLAAAASGPAAAERGSQRPARREELSYIWGTSIAVEEFRENFRSYLENFTLRDLEEPQDHAPAEGQSSHLAGTGSGAPLLPSTADGHERYYLQELVHMHMHERTTLEVDFLWLQRRAPMMYRQAVNYPTECLQMMSAVAEELYRDVLQHRCGVTVPEEVIVGVAPKHMPSVVALKQLSPQHLEQLLSVKGMVIRVSRILPEIRVACFRCWRCQYTEKSVSGDKGRISEPTRCAHCGQSYSFELQHNLSIYEDKQLVKLQESPENVADGETPVSISLVVYGSMVDAVVPGDRVIVTGIYRSVPIRLNANTRTIKSVFATHVDAVHIERVRATRLSEAKSSNNGRGANLQRTVATAAGTDADGGKQRVSAVDTMDPARLDVFHSLAHRPDIYDVLLQSFARTIWGHEDVKRGILAQLFGGTPKTFVFDRVAPAPGSDRERDAGGGAELPSFLGDASHHPGRPPQQQGNSAHFRSALNVILCGDPGVAKSQLLTQVHEIAPRGVYTSGKGSSSVGLTAFVVQDTETGELVLEPGALVLSDQGLCCIDEFDKMNESTRSVLHEVMEQQTLSIAKAGIIAQLNARTSILAAANPKESQWNPHLNVVENLQIEPTLLSRFDLIFLLLDRHDPEEDKRLAAHVLSLYMDKSGGERTRQAQRQQQHQKQQKQQQDLQAASADGNYDLASGLRSASSTGHVTATEPGSPGSPASSRAGASLDESTGLPIEVETQYDGEVFLQKVSGTAQFFMPPAILSEYIAIARDTVFPRLTESAHRQLVTSYVELRRARGGRTVSATLRQLESMIRLAEARAKMRYGSEVSVDDVVEAKRLISAALKEAATDPRTGLVNIDIFHAADPTSNTVEGSMRRLKDVVRRRFLSQEKLVVPVAELRMALNEHAVGGVRPVSPAQFMELLALMEGGDCVKSFTGSTVTLTTGEDQ